MEPIPSASTPPAPRRVLIVDDVPEIARVMKLAAERLVRPCIEAHVATSAQDALDLLARAKFDLVVSDYRMPNADGLAVLRAARRVNPGGFRWLMTGYNEVPAAPDELRASGLDAILRKPVTTTILFSMIRGTLGGDAQLVARLREEARALIHDARVADEAPAYVRGASA